MDEPVFIGLKSIPLVVNFAKQFGDKILGGHVNLPWLWLCSTTAWEKSMTFSTLSQTSTTPKVTH
jgi:hypothetical protein